MDAVTIELSPVAARVLGSLVEKEITTPEYYPLSLNALTNACNQKNNREPVMNLDEPSVVRGLDSIIGETVHCFPAFNQPSNELKEDTPQTPNVVRS